MATSSGMHFDAYSSSSAHSPPALRPTDRFHEFAVIEELDLNEGPVIAIQKFNGRNGMAVLHSTGTCICLDDVVMQAGTSTSTSPQLPPKIFSSWTVARAFAMTAQVSEEGSMLFVGTAR
jgi:hypothetical protein